jgi:hypothetical protein
MNIEKWAESEHDCWSDWMKYLFSKGVESNGSFIIPKELVERWKRQMNTSYSELTEKEKQSDRDVVYKYHKDLI